MWFSCSDSTALLIIDNESLLLHWEADRNDSVPTEQCVLPGSSGFLCLWPSFSLCVFHPLCAESLYGDSTDKPLLDCCACGTAKYRVTFYGNWSEKTHPKDYPRRHSLSFFFVFFACVLSGNPRKNNSGFLFFFMIRLLCPSNSALCYSHLEYFLFLFFVSTRTTVIQQASSEQRDFYEEEAQLIKWDSRQSDCDSPQKCDIGPSQKVGLIKQASPNHKVESEEVQNHWKEKRWTPSPKMFWQRKKSFKYKRGGNYAQVNDLKETKGPDKHLQTHTYRCNSIFVRTFVDIILSVEIQLKFCSRMFPL